MVKSTADPRLLWGTVTEALFSKLVSDLQTGSVKFANDRVRISDDQQPGLRIHVYKTGAVIFHAEYVVGITRALVKFGEWPDMSLQEAREITKIIRALAEKGIDVQDGFYPRLVRELKRDGVRWTPWEGYQYRGP